MPSHVAIVAFLLRRVSVSACQISVFHRDRTGVVEVAKLALLHQKAVSFFESAIRQGDKFTGNTICYFTAGI